MAFEYWDSLSDIEKFEIIKQAKSAHDSSGRHTCFWCGAVFDCGECDFNSNANDPRKICKGVCKKRRYFDNPY